MRKISIFIMACALSLASRASAEEYTPGPEMARRFRFNFHRQHDRGLHLQLGAGLGYVNQALSPPYQGEEVSQSGLRLTYAADLGAYVAPRLPLHLSQWGQVGSSRGALALGVGPSFWLREEKNVRATLRLGAATLYDDAPDVRFGSQWALAGEAELGMGMWVTADSSLSLSAVGGMHGFDLDGDDLVGSSWHAGLRVSFTLN